MDSRDILPPPNLTVMDEGFVRPMLNIVNTSRYKTCADRTFCRGTLYESAVSQQVNFGIVAKISGAGEEKTQLFRGFPLSISTKTDKGRFAPLCLYALACCGCNASVIEGELRGIPLNDCCRQSVVVKTTWYGAVFFPMALSCNAIFPQGKSSAKYDVDRTIRTVASH